MLAKLGFIVHRVCDLPICVQILFELARIQQVIGNDTLLLQRGNILANPVIKLWVVALGKLRRKTGRELAIRRVVFLLLNQFSTPRVLN